MQTARLAQRFPAAADRTDNLQFFTGLYSEVTRAFPIDEEPDVLANPPSLVDHPKANARKTRIEFVEQGAHRGAGHCLHGHLAAFARVASQGAGNVDANKRAHYRYAASTLWILGNPSTTAFQLAPSSRLAHTDPCVVPK